MYIRPERSDSNPRPPEQRPSSRPKPPSPRDNKPPLAGCGRYWLVGAVLAFVGLTVLGVVVAGVVLLVNASRPAHEVTVVVDGDAYTLESKANTVDALLTELDLQVSDDDAVTPPLQTALTESLVVQIERARAVTVTDDGSDQVIMTPLTQPSDILEAAGVRVTDEDRVVVDGTETTLDALAAWPVPVMHIAVKRSTTLTVNDAGETFEIETTRDTVGEALFEAGVTLFLADRVTPPLDSPVSPDETINIRRSQPLNIVVDGETLEFRTGGETVADALSDAGVGLMGLDYTIPRETSAVQPGMFIRVIRVTEQVAVERESVPFEVVLIEDTALELDQRDVAQEGQNGIIETRQRVRYENGVEISREVESEVMVQEPVNRVVQYGTDIVLRTVDTPEGPRQYWRRLRMYATSYHPEALGGDDVTATGATLTRGIVAADPSVIPYNTEVYVPGYGNGVMADTGGPRASAMWIDLGYDDENFRSWSQYVDVYLLAPVPPDIDYRLPD